MKYIVTICKEFIYEVHVRAKNEKNAIANAEKIFGSSQDFLIPTQIKINTLNVEERDGE